MEIFLSIFMARFIPESVRDGLAHEFERLEQMKGMTVLEYSACSTQLYRHAPYSIIEGMCVKMFIRVLKDYLFRYVVGLNCYTFAEVLSLALQIKQQQKEKGGLVIRGNKRLMSQRAGHSGQSFGTMQCRRSDSGAASQSTFPHRHSGVSVTRCSICCRFHFGNCSKDGNGKDDQTSNAVVTCILSICSKDGHVLFDPGATHSFVSSRFSSRLGKCSSFLEEALIVATHVGENLLAKLVYRSCDIVIEGKVLPIDLVVIDLVDFDVILGMDWLALHHATLDYHNKVVKFKILGQSVFLFQGQRCSVPHNQISSLRAIKLMRRGCKAYLALVRDTQVAEEKLEKIPAACEFPDVFPKELRGLPPNREIEFSIELVPNTHSISIRPYVWPQQNLRS
uniref:Uncharacterized protein LOC113784425 n=1 Tax=Cicer arietinum TaxID=3827 RepID=A0A3Q7YBB5_CICAR|nr:uncharacterized protein LOC113784425 [Cicer arietinum]